MNFDELKARVSQIQESNNGYDLSEAEAEKDADILANNKPLPRLGGVNTTISYGAKFVTPIEAALERLAYSHDAIVDKLKGETK